METPQDTPSISYPQLFSFQVSYAGDPGNSRCATSRPDDKKGDYRQGILEVDFYMETLFIQDRDRIFMSQSFSTLRNHVDTDYLDDCSISIKFDSELWKITSQNIAEKTCIQHLLECIVNGTAIEEALQIGKEKGIIGLDKSVQKHGYILRRPANHNKLEERYLILVPGKLLLFKNLDIIGKHVRYATSLLGATVRALPEEQEFQVSAPGSKTMSLISSNPKDFDSWVDAVETSIEYTKQAARAAGMATILTKKKRRSRGSKVCRVQWGDNGNINQEAQLLERGIDDTRTSMQVAQLNEQPRAEAVNPSHHDNPLQEDYQSNSRSRAAEQESREARPDAKDARKQSKAMMCLETALNEMRMAISNIRTVRIPGAATLWHKANLSPPRAYRSFEEHLQGRPDWEGRHRQPNLGHNYIDALISPRTRETLASSQHLRRSWDSTSTVGAGADLPRNQTISWRSQTMEDLNSSAPMYTGDEISRWRTSNYPTPQMSTKPTIVEEQQRSSRMDPELHGITSSDEEEDGYQLKGCAAGTSPARVSNTGRKTSMSTNGFLPAFAVTPRKSTRMPVGNAFPHITDIAHQQRQSLPPDMCLPEQHHASTVPISSTSEPTLEATTRTTTSRVKYFDLRASRASKEPFLPEGDAINPPGGEMNWCHQPGTTLPALSFTNGGERNYDVNNRQSVSLTNPGMQRISEGDMQTMVDAQAYVDQTNQFTSKNEAGLYERTSTSDSQRVLRAQYDFQNDPNQHLHVNQPMPSEYFSSKELYSEKKSMITENIQDEAAQQSRANLSSQQYNEYSNLRNSYKVVPGESLRQYPDVSRRFTQEAGMSAGEPPIFWESPIISAGSATPSGISTPSRRHSLTSHSQEMVQVVETTPGTATPSGISTPSRRHSQTYQSQGMVQVAETLNQTGPFQPPSRRYSQTLQYQEMSREAETSNGHSYESLRKNSVSSSGSVEKVHSDSLAVGQSAANGVMARGGLASEQSGFALNTTQLRNCTSDVEAVRNSDLGEAFISGQDLLAMTQNHAAMNQQQSYLQAGPDGGRSSFQPTTYTMGQLPNPELKNSIPNQYSLEGRSSYADTRNTCYDTAHIANGLLLRGPTGVEGSTVSQLDPNNATTYLQPNEQAVNRSSEASTTSEHMVASKHLEEAGPSVQVSDIAELVNRLVRITAGDELAHLQGTSTLEKSFLNAGPLSTNNSISQDPPSKIWDRQASLSRAADEATSSYQASQKNSYQPSGNRVSMPVLPAPQIMELNSNQEINSALQLQGLSHLSQNAASNSGPITLKSADGEVIIISKERRSSTGLLVPQGGDQAQANLVNTGIQVLRGQEGERLQDAQQLRRRSSLAGDVGSSNSEGDAWSLAILKPGTPAQIFKFETQ